MAQLDESLPLASSIATIIMDTHSGMLSGEPRGIRYPGVPSVASVAAQIGATGAEQTTSEHMWLAACDAIMPDDAETC